MSNRYDNSIAPRFRELANDLILDGGKYTHYILKGGRMSCKSSFIALTMILLMGASNTDGSPFLPGCHGAAFRRYSVHLAGSVYNRLLWAIGVLGVGHEWIKHKSPLELIHERSGNRIIFLGGDEPERLKSITVPNGYFRFLWFEELSEFGCEEDVRNILQSLMRGGNKFTVFYSYNPPKSALSWVNAYAAEASLRDDVLVHHSTYRTVPKDWVGEPALIEAERLKEIKPMAYRHELLGEVTGTGGAVFDNIVLRAITDEEIRGFEYVYPGLDLGFTVNPSAYIECSYSSGLKRLLIFYELYKVGLSNDALAHAIKTRPHKKTTVADSEDPRTISELRNLGVNIEGAKKGPDELPVSHIL